MTEKNELIAILLEHPEITEQALALFRELFEESKKLPPSEPTKA